MTIKALQNIIDFAEGGKLMSVVADGEKTDFQQGAADYSVQTTDGILQVMSGDTNYFFEIKKISGVEFIC